MEAAFQARLPGTPHGVRALRRELTAIAADCGMGPDGVADVRLAVSEAATNVVMHAYAESEGELAVTATVGGGELAIVIGDTGSGIVEGRDSPGLGIGLSIIATVAEKLRIVSSTEGTEIHMAFPCPEAA
jgi:anti-sigma regulatory factor (Ser/Thr protein kinase)